MPGACTGDDHQHADDGCAALKLKSGFGLAPLLLELDATKPRPNGSGRGFFFYDRYEHDASQAQRLFLISGSYGVEATCGGMLVSSGPS